MAAGSLSIKKRCFSFGTVERDDLSSVWPLLPQSGDIWSRTLAETYHGVFCHARGAFQEAMNNLWLSKAQQALAKPLQRQRHIQIRGEEK